MAMRGWVWVWIALCGASVGTAGRAADARPIVAVFEVQLKGAPGVKIEATTLTELLSSELGQGGVFHILPPGDVRRVLASEAADSYKACYEESCQIELGRQLPANKLLTSRVIKIGGECRLSASLYDLRRQITDVTIVEKGGCKEASLARLAERVAAKLRTWGAGFVPPTAQPPAPASAPKPAPTSPVKLTFREQKTAKAQPASDEFALEVVKIPAGEFWMGCSEDLDSECNQDELPHRKLSLPAYAIGRTEVTVAQYGKCLKDGRCREPEQSGSCNQGKPGRESHPINCVSWEDAQTYCAWAGMRLPSEAEWEKAARGDNGRIFPWGNARPSCALAVMEEGGNGCGKGASWPVCSREPGNSPYGLCDMAGNVWEWVQDWYHSSYEDAPASGAAWEDPPAQFRVARGGGWGMGAKFLRASARNWYWPDNRPSYLGFRCAKSLEEAPGP